MTQEIEGLPRETREQIDRICAALRGAMGESLAGLYLHGSAVMGCFCPASSDIDLIGVCAGSMDGAAQARVAGALLELEGRPHSIEISILSRERITPWRYPTPYEFHFSSMHVERMRAMLAAGQVQAGGEGDPDLAAHLSVCRARGRALIGPGPCELLPPVPYADYFDSIAQDFDWLRSDEVPAVYAVLNACRILRLAREEGVCSKREGGLWALEQPDVPVKPLIRRALDAYAQGRPLERGPELEELLGWAGVEIEQRRDELRR